MTNAQTACLGFLALVAVSCSSHAPVKVASGDQCFRSATVLERAR